MKTTQLASLILLAQAPLLSAGTLIFADNFNAPDNSSLDASDQTGRTAGLLGPTVQIRSARIQHSIVDNQLNLLNAGSGRVRFQNTPDLPANVITDFAAGAAGSTILAEGGLRIAFDWLPAVNTSDDWISFNAGIDDFALGEPAVRVNHAGTDFGILFRTNGGTQYFDNGAASTGDTFDVSTITSHRIIIDLKFSSFDDFETFTASASVDGTVVLPEGTLFQWDNNSGILNFELGNLITTGSRVDNFSITTLAGFSTALSNSRFLSSITSGGLIGLLSGSNIGASEPSTFSLVAGEGDTDNGKFRINGNRLEANGFDFRPLADGAPISLRIRGVGTVSAGSSDQIYRLLLVADADSDDLPDSFEGANLTDLNGRGTGPGPGAGTGNFDGDTLTDAEEFALSQGLYPNINPRLADTDGDGLADGLELNPADPRPVTNPTLADTDRDGLNDLLESNTGLFNSAADPGTSPLNYDSDTDGFPDGYEVTRGSDPLDSLLLPSLPPPLTIVELSTDASSGISSSKTYTHLISGGYNVLVNNVSLDPLTSTIPAPGLEWTANRNETTPAVFSEIGAFNANTWSPEFGDISEPGLLDLLGGFTFSGDGADPGSFQTFTLTGLTPGTSYELRLFVRQWSNVDSGRPISLTLTNGAGSTNAYILEDRPGIMLQNNNADSAYYLAYPYTAAGTDLVIRAEVPQTTIAGSGSWHLYGLTNEVAAAGSADFSITGISYQTSPVTAVTLTFASETGATYAVDSSTALSPAGQPGGWTQLVTNLPSGGTRTTFLDTTAAGTGPRIFYRVRRLP